MNTRKYKKITKSKTLKKKHYPTNPTNPETKTLEPGKMLYASKIHSGEEILKHAKIQEEKTHNQCIKDNITWLSNLTVAKLYKNESNHLYKWEVTSPAQLLKTTLKNKAFFEKVFKNATAKLEPFIKTGNQTKTHKYFKMTSNEKALYEFNFVFGYLSIDEQYEFLNLLKPIKKINQTVLSAAINYYRINKLSSTLLKNTKMLKRYNRISFYEIDRHVVNNLCKALDNSPEQFSEKFSKSKNIEKKIEGIYQSAKIKSFWYPSFVKYSKNMEEYIIFNPQHDLTYVGEIK